MPLPSMDDYLLRHDSYQQFAALALLAAALLAAVVVRFGAGGGCRLRLPLWGICGLAAALRWPLLSQSYWYDETFTSMVVGGSWDRLWSIVMADVHPPLYYAIVKVFVLLGGHSDIVMRLPAFLSGLMLVIVFYWIGRTHGGHQVGLIAAAIVAIMPSAIYYSAEARYPMFLALALALAYLGVQQRLWWLGSVALAVAALTHVNAWFYVVLLGGFAVVQARRVWVMYLPALAMLSWFPVALRQSQDVSDGFWLQQSTTVRYLVDMTITSRFPDTPLLLVLAVIGAALAVIGAAVWSWRRQASALWLLTVAAPPLLQWSVGLVWHPVYLERTLLFSALLLAVPIAWWIGRARRAVVLVGAATLIVGYAHLLNDRTDLRHIFAACDDAYIVYAPSTYSAILATHYTDALVITSPSGNAISQTLPTDVRQKLWLLIDFNELPQGACLISQIDSFTPRQQLEQISQLTRNPQIIPQNSAAYFLIDTN